MADSQQPVEQQVTSQTPATQQVTPATKQKNPKCVAAGKLIAQKTKKAREAHKRALIEAQSIIANKQLKPAPGPPANTPSADPLTVAADPPPEPAKNVLTTTQWLSVISIIVSLAGIYYKREEIKSVFTTPPVEFQPPRAPQPSPVDAKRRVGIVKMD